MNYIDNLKQDISNLPNGMIFNARVKFMQRICEALLDNHLPRYHFPKFQLSEKEITNYMQQNVTLNESEFETMSQNLEKLDHDLGEFRTYLQTRFGYWATITQDFVEQLTIDFPEQSFLELMAGNGYLSKGLRDLKVETYCTDDRSWAKHDQTGNLLVTDVEKLDALSALNKYGHKVDNVILAWSPDREEIDVRILQRIRELDVNFLVIGEKYGATNSRTFWDKAELVDDVRIKQVNRVYSRYDLVHDQLYLVK
ncbi:hypothetical protein COSHB9_12440 [Companilactobacillus alimentarius]|uniref:SAM-dependent methyltransferase n=1 Tax=Companilactobacillus alimentarius DSM 20249 TaxID=1423720 RepID=A0A2K9HJR6_9LACO|nr:hypothetical protein [Companilactobacillus alimentarius]AUI72770.1 hypothetical protein LA20249_03095 [Companilactobacillus alimentarius DSM 20249]MDT6951477.1 hypothetical protein [Companilactobacillus alimentarius]GEO43837.1 hypothetical protein LAL01_00690 [Companilactobacillus alimentarius]